VTGYYLIKLEDDVGLHDLNMDAAKIFDAEVMKIIGPRIRDIRKKKGISQQEMADALDVSYSFYGQVERGIKVPGFITFLTIVFLLDVSSPEILKDVLPADRDYGIRETEHRMKQLSSDQYRISQDVLGTLLDGFEKLNRKKNE